MYRSSNDKSFPAKKKKYIQYVAGIQEGGSAEEVITALDLTSLISHWSLENFNWLDAHGTNNLTAGGNDDVTATTGKVGNCAVFLASQLEYLEHVSNSDLVTGDIDFMITCWVYLATKPAGLTPIMGKWNDTAVTGILSSEWKLVYEGNDDTFEFIASTGLINQGVETEGLVSTATWYFLAVGYDSTNNVIKISRNANDFNVAALASVNASTTAFKMGNVVANTHYHNGRIDEVSFWKRLLTVDELVFLYNGGAGLAYPFGN